jgi:hypothetical protein
MEVGIVGLELFKLIVMGYFAFFIYSGLMKIHDALKSLKKSVKIQTKILERIEAYDSLKRKRG